MDKTKQKTKLNFKIGADPEFALIMQGRKIDARQTLQYILRGKPEFRELDMSTISEFGPIGGHIHLEIPKGEKYSTDKQHLIHRKVSSFYLPIILSENKTNMNIRIRQGYGALNDCRIEPRFKYDDGSPGLTYEFRCPSAEWLTTPKIAKATLAFLATIYNEVINHPKNIAKYDDIVYKSDKQGDALQQLAIMEYSPLTNQILQKTRKYIKQFELYPEFKEEIDYILSPKQVIADKVKADYNIAIGWGLSKKTKPQKKQILASKAVMQKMAKEGDFDQIKRIMNIHYNEDTNVGLFAENLKDKIAAFNWKLKNNYFIFGIRKGIEEIVCRNLKNEYFSGRKLIKTMLDKREIDKLFSKMSDRFMDGNGFQSNTIIDFKTGKPKNVAETSIVIGLPYSMRVEENLKPFLELIWNLENEKITPEIFKANVQEQLKDDLSIPLNERGEVYKILTKQVDEVLPQNNVIFAENDNRSGEAILHDIAHETTRNTDIERAMDDLVDLSPQPSIGVTRPIGRITPNSEVRMPFLRVDTRPEFTEDNGDDDTHDNDDDNN